MGADRWFPGKNKDTKVHLEKYCCDVRQDTSGPQGGKLAEGSEKPALLEVPVLRTALCELAENAGQ